MRGAEAVRRAALAALMGPALGPGLAQAEEAVTVQSLLDDGFAVVSSIWTGNVGPGVFLQKGSSLYLCFVREQAADGPLTTQYCKAVH